MRKTICCMLWSLLLLCLLIVTGGCTQEPDPLMRSGIYFDTVITLKIYDTREEDILEHCFTLCETYEHLFSTTLEDSDIYRVNHANGQPVTVSMETIRILETAIAYSKLTDGAFDCTLAPLSELWDFKQNPGILPDSGIVSETLKQVGFGNIQLKGNTVTLANPKAAIDLGGIAKGYIADRLKEYLIGEGIQHALINLGGNTLAIGTKPDHTAWNIGIQEPFAPEGTPLVSLKITDKSLVTSGIYERYFEKDGKIYHHILDTSTGYPVENDLYSVTILSDHSADGDALSTSCFALGLADGMELIESLPDVEALFVDSNQMLHVSSGLQ